MVTVQKTSILSLRMQLTLSSLFSFLNKHGFLKLLITIFNSIILLNCCYLEVQSSLGKLSKTVSRTGFSAALLLQLRIHTNTCYPSPREKSESVRAFAAHSRVTVTRLSTDPPRPPGWVGRRGQPLAPLQLRGHGIPWARALFVCS